MTFLTCRKKEFHKEQFFSVGFFFSPVIFSPLKRTQDDGGFILYTCRVVLWPWTRPINHIFNTGRDSVDSPSGCKVKTLMYSTFANELVCLRNCVFSVPTLF